MAIVCQIPVSFAMELASISLTSLSDNPSSCSEYRVDLLGNCLLLVFAEGFGELGYTEFASK
jgi:hypothetical protein